MAGPLTGRFPTMTLINSRSMKVDMSPKGQNLAARDIVRRNHLGQNVLVVPKGQPIPDGLDVTDEERGVKKQTERYENKAAAGRPTPKSSGKTKS